MDILKLDRAGVLALDPKAVDYRLMPDEFIHIATALDAYWQYDYEAAQAGRVGQHALLKSGLHSDGFFVSRILLDPINIRYLMAQQMVSRLRRANIGMPTHVAGIPDGATLLGEAVADILGLPHIKLVKSKADGKISLAEHIPDDARLLLPEDFCTRATGFMETVVAVLNSNLCEIGATVLPVDPVILNRGGLTSVTVLSRSYSILPVVERRINDWEPAHCPLCAMGSTAVKPKVDDATWQRFTHSQD
jgi:orotate phosphoribosyltransferase